jgi:hypothetical protein
MKRAVLYARVSTDAQQKEGTIDSQVLELKRQIAAAGDVLVKEYVDDGYSRFPARSAGARSAAKRRTNPSLRCGVLPRYRSHRPRCRIPNDHPWRIASRLHSGEIFGPASLSDSSQIRSGAAPEGPPARNAGSVQSVVSFRLACDILQRPRLLCALAHDLAVVRETAAPPAGLCSLFENSGRTLLFLPVRNEVLTLPIPLRLIRPRASRL